MENEVSDTGAPSASPEDRLVQFFTRAPAARASTTPPPVEAAPSEEVSAPIEGQATEEAPESPEAPEEEQVSDAPPEGYVELEHLGKKWHVPEELKTAFEENRKMATKTAMELAPVRKALEVEKLAMQAAKAVDKELTDLTSQLAQLNSYKEQAKKLDWSALTLDQKVDLDRELRQVAEQSQALEQQISAKRNDAQQRFGQFVVQAVTETERFMASKVPGWNPDKGKALHEYGSNYGIPPEKLTAGWFSDPVATHIMWKAQQWDSLQSSKPAVANRAKEAPPVIKPASNQVQKSVAASNYQKVRSNLKRTGSLEDFAAALLARKG